MPNAPFLRRLILGLSIFLSSTAFAQDLSHTSLPEPLKTAILDHIAAATPECRRTYMVAMSDQGDYATGCRPELPEADQKRWTLEYCEHGANAPCGLVLIGEDPIQLQNDTWTIEYAEVFDPDAIPFLSTHSRRQIAGAYAENPGRKALAINRNGSFGFAAGGQPGDGRAEAVALESCEKNTQVTGSCFLYAVETDVVFSRTTDIFPDK